MKNMNRRHFLNSSGAAMLSTMTPFYLKSEYRKNAANTSD